MKAKELKLNNETVVMNVPTVGIFRQAMKKEGEMEQAIFMIAALINKTEQEVDALEIDDYAVLQEALFSFLPKSGAK